jgi:nitrogen fixation protein NifB
LSECLPFQRDPLWEEKIILNLINTDVSDSADPVPHPCFHPEAAGRYGRIHLPVAPECNIHCRYCNRAFDCTNESRPGVTSKILEPEEALAHLESAIKQMPWLTVAGIAGPGDAFADPERTLKTIEHIRRRYPLLHICLSTNGLALTDHIPELAELGVGFVTVTTNAVDPLIGARIYARIQFRGKKFHGAAGAEVLIDRQLEAISQLKSHNITVKVNTVVIPDVNNHHVLEIAKEIAQRKVDLHNLIALIPVSGTIFSGCTPPSPALMTSLRKTAGTYVTQMLHCARCRADAVGLLHNVGSQCLPPSPL